jgi:DNA-binding CsgD family transcriptional regulator
MKTGFHARDSADSVLPEEMLKQIMLQLPLGLICTDLQGKILFVNATARELIELNPLSGEPEPHTKEALFPELPPEISRGIDCLRGLLTQSGRTYANPFPKLLLHSQAGYEIEFFLYSHTKELDCESLKEGRIVVLLKSDKFLIPTTRLAKRFALTNREQEVLHYLVEGKARKEIATVMNLSEDTVRSYLRTLYGKLGARSRVEAATLWLRLELLENLQSALQLQE